MGISINTTAKYSPKELNYIKVNGSTDHVTLKAQYSKGERSKAFSFTMGRSEAIELLAAISAVLSISAGEQKDQDAGRCGNSMDRFPSFNVRSEQHRVAKHIPLQDTARCRKPSHYQHQKSTKDSNGNSRSLYVLYRMDGNIHSVIEGHYNTPKECWGLFELDSVNISPKDYRSLLKGWD